MDGQNGIDGTDGANGATGATGAPGPTASAYDTASINAALGAGFSEVAELEGVPGATADSHSGDIATPFAGNVMVNGVVQLSATSGTNPVADCEMDVIQTSPLSGARAIAQPILTSIVTNGEAEVPLVGQFAADAGARYDVAAECRADSGSIAAINSSLNVVEAGS